jgi:solute carrier organic anion transporter family, member 5A
MALRTVGPAVGFILGFACLSIYVDPTLTPAIKRRDPRWIGAWWLGWIILGTAMTLFAFLMALFPAELPTAENPIKNENIHIYAEIASEKEENSLYKVYYENEIVSKKEVEESERISLKRDSLKNTKDNENVLKGFLNALKRVLTNPLLMANNLTAVFYILGVSGYINFYIKYTETQFHQSAAASSVLSGKYRPFSRREKN